MLASEITQLRAGITYFFTITFLDIYGNTHFQTMTDDGLDVAIMADYVDHDAWPSPIAIADAADWQAVYGSNISGIAIDNSDGTMTGQVTIYRAGEYTLNIQVNSLHISQSPHSPLQVKPTYLYAPYCVPLGIPATMTAGTPYSFQIQGRDFYQNNIQDILSAAVGTDHSITYSLVAEDSDRGFAPVVVDAVISDDTTPGVYSVDVTLTKAGRYSLLIRLRGLEVPT